MIHTLPAKDLAEIRRLTDDALARGLEHSVAEWRMMALEALYSVARTKERFTVNDVRPIVDASPIKTHDKRAMGGVIAMGRKLGWIEATGEAIPSKVGHMVPIQIWKSKIIELKAPVQFPSRRHVFGRHSVIEKDGNFSCSCPGYRYRGSCRHVQEVQDAQRPTLFGALLTP